MNMLSKTIITIGLMSFALISHASEGFYAGFNYGQASWDVTLDDVAFLDDGSIISASLDDSDTSYSLILGYQFNPNFALEGGFIDFGELNVDATSDGTGFLYAPGPVNLNASADGLFFNAKGIIPLSEMFSLYGKLGLLMWDAEVTLSDSTGRISDSDDGNDLFYGVGGSLNITRSLALNADYSLYTLDETDVDVLSIGIQYSF